MEETENDLTVGVGTKEIETLEPKKVKITDLKIGETGEKKHKILYIGCQHPDKEEVIKISKVKIEKLGKLQVSATWINMDSDKKLQKGSPVAMLLDFLGCKNIKELEGKEIETAKESESSNYLVLKAY